MLSTHFCAHFRCKTLHYVLLPPPENYLMTRRGSYVIKTPRLIITEVCNKLWNIPFLIRTLLNQYTGLFKMTVGILTTCHTQYTWDRSRCIFLFNRTTLQGFLHTLQVLCMCTLCDSTNINTIIGFVLNCL